MTDKTEQPFQIPDCQNKSGILANTASFLEIYSNLQEIIKRCNVEQYSSRLLDAVHFIFQTESEFLTKGNLIRNQRMQRIDGKKRIIK